jgi:hypothetical protein
VGNRIFWIKLAHSLIFFFFVGCLVYIAYAGAAGRFDKWLWLSIGAILFEGAVLWLNKGHCPMTNLAEKYGADNGSVTDIFLPPVIARNTFRVSFPLAVVEIVFVAVRYWTGW